MFSHPNNTDLPATLPPTESEIRAPDETLRGKNIIKDVIWCAPRYIPNIPHKTISSMHTISRAAKKLTYFGRRF